MRCVLQILQQIGPDPSPRVCRKLNRGQQVFTKPQVNRLRQEVHACARPDLVIFVRLAPRSSYPQEPGI